MGAKCTLHSCRAREPGYFLARDACSEGQVALFFQSCPADRDQGPLPYDLPRCGGDFTAARGRGLVQKGEDAVGEGWRFWRLAFASAGFLAVFWSFRLPARSSQPASPPSAGSPNGR